METNQPYSEFATFDFSKILERLKGKVVKYYGEPTILDDIRLTAHSQVPIRLELRRLCDGALVPDTISLGEFQEFLDNNKQPNIKYTIYYKVSGDSRVTTMEQNYPPTKEQFMYVQVLDIIKTNSDGSKECVELK